MNPKVVFQYCMSLNCLKSPQNKVISEGVVTQVTESMLLNINQLAPRCKQSGNVVKESEGFKG